MFHRKEMGPYLIVYGGISVHAELLGLSTDAIGMSGRQQKLEKHNAVP